MKIFLKAIIFVLSVSILFGCHGNSSNDQKSQNERNIAKLSKNLSKHRVRVFRDTNSITLKLSNRNIFTNNSANFIGGAYSALDLIVGLASYYEKSSISVTSYSKGSYDYNFGKALAMERARKIARYLWESGVDANFVYADGKLALADRTLIVISNIRE